MLIGALMIGGFAPGSNAATKRKCVPTKTKKCPPTTTKRKATTQANLKTTVTVAATTTTPSTTAAPTPTTTTVAATTIAPTTVPTPPTGNDIGAWQAYFRQTFPADAVVLTTAQPAIDCAGKPLVLRGDGLSVTSTNCSPVMIDGNGNTLTIDVLNPGGTILGDRNVLLFRSGAANGLRIAGNSNTVRPA
jgi:hypothetical protein